MAVLDRSSLRPLMDLFLAHLASELKIDPSRVIMTALEFDEVPHLSADVDLLVGLANEVVLAGREGGGRSVNMRSRMVQVMLRTRSNLDRPDADLHRLMAETTGHIDLTDSITDALESFCVTTTAGNMLALPLLVGEWSKPRRMRGKEHRQSGWLSSWCNVTVRYLRNLTQP